MKIYSNGFGHNSKMAAMPIYGKTPLQIFFRRTKRTCYVNSNWDVSPTKFVQMMILG